MEKLYTDFAKLAYLKGVIDTIITTANENSEDETANMIAKLLTNALDVINKK